MTFIIASVYHYRVILTSVVQKVDNTIHGINHYPVDSFIHPSNSWGLDIKYATKLDISSIGMKYVKVSYSPVRLGGPYGEKLFPRFLVGPKAILC